ncbi:MAG: cation:proton antiporter [Halobacteriales archaeon SW_8_66_22]|nr:MAG: cation:proton antiporter [Halobacteriales archaeon QS_4_66_20]PSQ62731.1 MAG: cation:proton antiporter [Halobacteriales archaeon SW_8_66_22]
MTFVIAATVGALFALGTFLLLRDDLVKVVWGLSIITQAANVYLIAMGGIREGTHDLVPILSGHGGEEVPATTDPLVQALVLTAIVISFGMTAFALVLSYRAYQENGTMNVREFAQ